jgi:hypothetical protein
MFQRFIEGLKTYFKEADCRIHPLDYRIDFNTKTLRIAVLNNQWDELRLKWYNYLGKYPRPAEL